MSTLISDLDSVSGGAGGGDVDYVQSILNEMNTGGGGQPAPNPAHAPMPAPMPPAMAPAHSQGSVIYAPNPNTIAPHVMDANPATAHIIGNSHPTPADFAQIIPNQAMGGSAHGAAAASWGTPPARQYTPPPPKRSWLARSLDEFRTAFFVVILVFVFSLPVVNFLFAHYLPRMVKPTGELTIAGLLIKSFAAGTAFWVLHRVIVPLLSL